MDLAEFSTTHPVWSMESVPSYTRETLLLNPSRNMMSTHCIVGDQLRTMAVVKVMGQDFDVDNRWVVPYSSILSKAFEAHINVEYCNSAKS